MSTFNDPAQTTLFEAPNSAEVQPVHDRKHFSIDLSLELERQLEMDSAPVTPAHDLTSAVEDTKQKHEALDPEILAHLVMQLRHSLSEMTKDRDELAKLLAAANNKEASLTDALQLMTEKATTINEELDIARRKNKEDEEAIVLLRAKVEESRRGLMRLQTESRRQTMAPIDVNRASLLGNPSPNKRASFTPLTGRSNAHRRISSVSDTSFANLDLHPSPNAQTLSFPLDITGTSPPSSSARFPAAFGRRSPADSNEPSSPKDDSSPQMEDLRRDLRRIKEELDTTKHELAEANEAREASETCVKALRQFIAENSFDEVHSSALPPSSIKLPPPPTMTTGDELNTEVRHGRAPSSGWGFKLWGSDSPRVPATATVVPQSAPAYSPQLGGSTPTLPSAPITRKLGGFFGSRASISSTTSSNATFPPLQTNASTMKRVASHETTSSDASSTLEPLSPSDDIHGLGTGPVIIRDSTHLSDAGSVHGLQMQGKSLDMEIIR